jgi:hypothetical protein
MNACDMCGVDLDDCPGPAIPKHGVFINIVIAGQLVLGYVGGVCDECLSVPRKTAAVFERARRERAGEPAIPAARAIERGWVTGRIRRAVAILIGGR